VSHGATCDYHCALLVCPPTIEVRVVGSLEWGDEKGRWCRVGGAGFSELTMWWWWERRLSSLVARCSMTHHVEAEAALSSLRSKLFQHKDVCY